MAAVFSLRAACGKSTMEESANETRGQESFKRGKGVAFESSGAAVFCRWIEFQGGRSAQPAETYKVAVEFVRERRRLKGNAEYVVPRDVSFDPPFALFHFTGPPNIRSSASLFLSLFAFTFPPSPSSSF